MSDITLSKAVRSNLLNLQNTAQLLSKSQERLSSGLRVNSALDNPTNFFTAQGLNSRASDLSQLADAVSNAVQTVAAADKGITAITKLVESAQATARQALQTALTVTTTTAATAGTVTAGTFSAVDVSSTGSAATSAVVQGSGFAAMTLAAGQTATASTVTAGATFTDIDLSDDAADELTFDVTLGSDTVSITLDRAGSGGGGAGVDNIYDIDEAIAEIQAQLDAFNAGAGLGVTVGKDGAGTSLTFTADVAGATALTIDNAAVSAANASVDDLGITDAATTGQANTGLAQIAADTLSFSLTVGSATHSVTIDSTSGDGAGSVTAQEVADEINALFGSTVATVDTDGELVITDSATGTGSTVNVGTITATGAADPADLGLGAGGGGAVNGSAAGTAASISFSLSVDGAAQTITISDASVDQYNTDNSASLDSSALTAANIAAIINDQYGSTVASVTSGGALEFTSGTTGTTSTVTITGFASAGTVGGSTGIANDTDTGAAASTQTVTNTKRAELVETYNDLLGQIDALAKDASYNGVNLLANDKLSVLFNEDGSSKIDIQGVDNSATGLNLTTLSTTAFDTNASINTTLDTLKSAIDTLRSQSAKFGSNLSVVETRQDFTKQMINVLQTGAANLTLADTNEEAANVLALQTRQQLSSTALSLASQADQNVLRLF